MSDAPILYDACDGVAVIRFNRPASRNAWNVPLVRAVKDAVRRANADETIGAIVLTGEGTVYSAGVDFRAPSEPRDETGRSPNPATLTMGQGEDNWLKLLNDSKPVIAAVNGAAVGLGATHVLSADIRVAARSASFSFPFLKLGAMPECGGTALLGRIVGFGRAMDLCLRAREISAEEALRIGLVTEVFEDADLMEQTVALASRIAAFQPLPLSMTKKMMWDHAGLFDPDALMRAESAAFVRMLRAAGRSRSIETAPVAEDPADS